MDRRCVAGSGRTLRQSNSLTTASAGHLPTPRQPFGQIARETGALVRQDAVSCYHLWQLILSRYASRIRHPHDNATRLSAASIYLNRMILPLS